jgi:hypothetical protein
MITNKINSINILAIGRHKEILDKVVELINKNTPYDAIGALTDDEALKQFMSVKFDIVLLCGGIEPTSDKYLRKFFLNNKADIIIIQHFGGGSGLLYNEIRSALNQAGIP